MTATCINLKARFGSRYRISHDEAAVTWGERADPWMMVIPCKGGISIYPKGGNSLAVEVDYHRNLAKRLEAITGVELIQDGDHEKTFAFDVSLLDKVAAIVKPRKRKRLTDEQRAKAIARLASYRKSPPSRVSLAGQSHVLVPEGG